MKKGILFLFLLVFGAVLLAACSSSDNTSGDSKNASGDSETAPVSGEAKNLVVRVGTSPTYPPFESEVNGELAGFDIALIKKIGEEEGFDVEFSQMQFDGLIPALKSGQVDVVVGALSITKSRMDSVNFSNAYYESGLSILTNPDSGITGFEDLQDKLIGIQKGTSSYNYMVENGIEDSNIKQYADIATAYIALENGGVDAILYDHPSNINYIQTQDTDAQIVGDILAGEHYGIAINKEKEEILQKVNDGLAKIQENGEYEKLFDEYLNGEKNGFIDEVIKPEDVVIDR
ncbi:basic amino acid ABC transporter substrate-binding protein [Lysinibacillus yapensis]|uniref:Basic amino acid ABC transporter substrate-binding protein n=1 Tax=Ureibacillus yapensis TaxID=2304605 RepID=A0A396S762_9BACL|nr:basic amino acid ABC transporter substrate-binding protein [Lysinibacillus yapensis]RHW36695.1 basic amino acid ABC transporter substrate-binding protein [Lysinibacillus yapensis]